MTPIYLLLLVGQVLCAKAPTDICQACHTLVETFEEGLRRTSRDNFGGGDTAWEEKNLGKYSTSETRLVEATEGLCEKGDKNIQFKCAALREEHEEDIEEYYFKHQQENMTKWLCVDRIKVCCLAGHFGSDCTPCPGLELGAEVCFGNGKCNGDGTRKGTGRCACEAGYSGNLCRKCDSNYYEYEKTDKKILCGRCFEGCAGGCSKAGPLGCSKCKAGWLMSESEGCQDVDECRSDVPPCTEKGEKCVNTDGSYRCECEEGYKKENGKCELDIEAKPLPSYLQYDVLLRAFSYTSLVIIMTFVYYRRSITQAVLVVIAITLVCIVEIKMSSSSIPDNALNYLPFMNKKEK